MSMLRTWATPITIGSFVISAVTGVALFFHLDLGLSKPAHEWLSWFMVIGVGMHMALNWRSFKGYFKKKIALAVIAIFFVLTVLSLLPLQGNDDKSRSRAPRATMMKTVDMVGKAPLSSLAPLFNMTEEALLSGLAEQGIDNVDSGQSLQALAKANGKEVFELLTPLLP